MCFSKSKVKFEEIVKGMENEGNDWDGNVENNAVDPVHRVGRDKMVKAIKEMKAGKLLNLQLYIWS